MNSSSRRLFYVNLTDWTWWAWAITTALLIRGLSGHDGAYLAAMAVTAAQGIFLLVHNPDPCAFPFQIRAAYLLLLAVCHIPYMRWLYWLPTIGTFALVTFGYCLLVRILSLMPWNNREAYTLARLRRTFFSAPDLSRVARPQVDGGLCTIEAQVEPDRGDEETRRAQPIVHDTATY